MKIFNTCIQLLVEGLNAKGFSLDYVKDNDNNSFSFKVIRNKGINHCNRINDWVFTLTIDDYANLVLYAYIKSSYLKSIRSETYCVRIQPRKNGELNFACVYELINELIKNYKYHFYKFYNMFDYRKPSNKMIQHFYNTYHD